MITSNIFAVKKLRPVMFVLLTIFSTPFFAQSPKFELLEDDIPGVIETFGVQVKMSEQFFTVTVKGISPASQGEAYSLYVYSHNGTKNSISFLQKIDYPYTQTDSRFGFGGLFLNDEFLLVGAENHNVTLSTGEVKVNAGLVLVYKYSEITNRFELEGNIEARFPSAYCEFGSSIDLNGDLLAIGAMRDSRGPNGEFYNVHTGSVELFQRVDTTSVFHYRQKLQSSSTYFDLFQRFGHEVKVDNDKVIVSSLEPNADGTSNPGAVYIFNRVGQAYSWNYAQRLTVPNASPAYYIENTLEASENRLVFQAYQDGGLVNYFYTRNVNSGMWFIDQLLKGLPGLNSNYVRKINGLADDSFYAVGNDLAYDQKDGLSRFFKYVLIDGEWQAIDSTDLSYNGHEIFPEYIYEAQDFILLGSSKFGREVDFVSFERIGNGAVFLIDKECSSNNPKISAEPSALVVNESYPSYQWAETLGQIQKNDIVGETTSSYSPETFSTYHVNVIGPEGCLLSSQSIRYQISSVSELSKSKIFVYPIPSADFLMIESDVELLQIEIIDSRGVIVMNVKTNKVNISDLSAGIYTLRIMDTELNETIARIVKN